MEHITKILQENVMAHWRQQPEPEENKELLERVISSCSNDDLSILQHKLQELITSDIYKYIPTDVLRNRLSPCTSVVVMIELLDSIDVDKREKLEELIKKEYSNAIKCLDYFLSLKDPQ